MANSLPRQQIITSGSFSASFNSDPANVSQTLGFSCQIIWSGGSSPVGTLQLQASNDLTNWEDISSGSYSVAANSGSKLFNLSDVQYNFVRVKYTKTSGTSGVVNAYVDSKN